MNKELKGNYVKLGSQGSFLCPPNHPNYKYVVSKYNEFYISLDSVANGECNYLPNETINCAKKIMNDYMNNLPDINSIEVKNWIKEVLSYFKNCYSKDGIGRNVNTDLEVHNDWNIFDKQDRHLGIMYIKEFYPNFKLQYLN